MCDYPNCNKPGKYWLGVSKAKSKKAERLIGAIYLDNMKPSINNIMDQAFATIYWVTIYDLNNKLLYHSFDAHLEGYAAAAGWELFVNTKI